MKRKSISQIVISLICISFINPSIQTSWAGETVSLFDGKTLAGWQAKDNLWRVEDGAITGGSLSEKLENHSFLASTQSFQNFALTLKVKMQGTEGAINSGIQVRSMRVPGSFEMSGYQIDVGYWGAIYDNARRRKYFSEAANTEASRAAVKPEDWNTLRILCEGPRIRTWLNGVPISDYTETENGIAQYGHIGLQLHGNAKMVIQFKDIVLKKLPDTPNGLTWDQTGFFTEHGGVRWDLQRDK